MVCQCVPRGSFGPDQAGPPPGYATIGTREPYLRGRLEVARQIGAAGGLHQFSVQLDEYSLDRPENRILRSAVEHVARNTASSENWRRARELSALLGEVPESGDVGSDLGKWERGRQLADYGRVKPLAELLLTHQLPFATLGDRKGMSMLFPMERLLNDMSFLQCRPRSSRASSPFGNRADITSALGAEEWFRLKPDMLVHDEARRWIIDAKWKRLNPDRSEKFGLAQADFYQLFAYGQKYLGIGDMFLMYPGTDEFPEVPDHSNFPGSSPSRSAVRYALTYRACVALRYRQRQQRGICGIISQSDELSLQHWSSSKEDPVYARSPSIRLRRKPREPKLRQGLAIHMPAL
ncbi:hypothetical protein HED54_26485 [Ochrobactrum anthropi ATCC 49188]|nr:hypothetical protein [Brucella anthropi ATCC 49188]